MFFPGSRYVSLGTYSVAVAGGGAVLVTKLPTPGLQAVLGYYRRNASDRLDQIAARFLSDPTAFWRLCDANGAIVPDALNARSLVGVPLGAPVGG
jgi:hypothetical protein